MVKAMPGVVGAVLDKFVSVPAYLTVARLEADVSATVTVLAVSTCSNPVAVTDCQVVPVLEPPAAVGVAPDGASQL
jgi:hypothetical protein